jgi:hypothetical protein
MAAFNSAAITFDMRYNPIRWIIKTIKEPSPKKDVLFAFVVVVLAAIGFIWLLLFIYSKL